MSIDSEIAADYANKIKKNWVKELRKAYKDKDWNKIEVILKKIEDFYFSE